MHFETGGTFSPSIRNAAGSGATGLIQFMPSTAKGLGTTTDKLALMTAVEQLDYVARYFRPYAKRVKTLSDMYMAILLPSAIGKPENHPLFSGGVAYRQNSGLDTDKDGKVTKAEASAKVMKRLVDGVKTINAFDVSSTEEPMAPFLVAALPALVSALPEFAKIFNKPDVSERNVEAAVKASEIVMQAVGATNVQEAVEKVQTDPEAAVMANNAIRVNRVEIIDLIERINSLDQANIKSAREYNTGEPLFVNTRWLKMKFVHILSLGLVIFTGSFAWSKFGLMTPEIQSMVITAIIIGGFTAVIAYWLGSSSGSDKKTDDIINRLEK